MPVNIKGRSLLCLKEVQVVPSSMYGRGSTGRDMDAAAALLANEPEVARRHASVEGARRCATLAPAG